MDDILTKDFKETYYIKYLLCMMHGSKTLASTHYGINYWFSNATIRDWLVLKEIFFCPYFIYLDFGCVKITSDSVYCQIVMAGYDTVHRTKKYKYKKNERNKNIWCKKGEFGANWIMDFF